ncbi:Leucyl aminopeptidase yscIV, partial [Kickxella alabastrina]
MFEIDPNSQSNLDEVTTLHVHLDVAVDFGGKVLRGSAALDMQALKHTQEVILDSAHLVVKSASLVDAAGQTTALSFDMSTKHKIYGTALRMALPEPVAAGDKFRIAIEYETTSKGGAIQFLTPEQTLGKSYPYLFTQCEEIHARSMFPCQDSPSVKIAYSAEVQ